MCIKKPCVYVVETAKFSHELWMDIQNDNFYLEKYYLMYILSHKYLLSAIQATLIKYKFHIINA